MATRLNSVTLDKNVQASTISFNGLKVTTVKIDGTSYNCIRTEDIQNYKAFIRTAQVEFHNNSSCSEITVHLLEEIDAHWSTNLHLKLLTLQQEIEEFFINVRNSLNIKKEKKKNTATVLWNLRIFGIFAFYIRISERHSAKVALGKII